VSNLQKQLLFFMCKKLHYLCHILFRFSDRNSPTRCDYTYNFPLNVLPECHQTYHYRKVLAITNDGRPISEHFEFPSCCKCIITVGKQVSSGTSSRLGSENPETKSNVNEDPYILPY
jgi:Spaetzle